MTKGKQWVAQDLMVDDIMTHKDLQFRVLGLSLTNTNRIRRALEVGGETRDPIRVARVGKALYVVDGFHRLEAYRLEGRMTVPSLVAKMSLGEAQEFARTANAANGKPLSQTDKAGLWEAFVADGRHLDTMGTPRPSRAIAADLGQIWSHETVRKKLKALGFEPDLEVEFPGGYEPRRSLSEEELAQERLDDAHEALADIAGLLPTLDEWERERLLGIMKQLVEAIEARDDEGRQEVLKHLRGGPLDI